MPPKFNKRRRTSRLQTPVSSTATSTPPARPEKEPQVKQEDMNSSGTIDQTDTMVKVKIEEIEEAMREPYIKQENDISNGFSGPSCGQNVTPERIKVEDEEAVKRGPYIKQENTVLVGTYEYAGPSNNQRVATDVVKTEEDDEVEIVEPEETFFGIIYTNVVGLRYYTGIVGVDEQVCLVREPSNRHDSNAIAVYNIDNHQVGHVPRQVAYNLAKVLDQKIARVEGYCPEGSVGHYYNTDLVIRLFGDPAQLESALTILDGYLITPDTCRGEVNLPCSSSVWDYLDMTHTTRIVRNQNDLLAELAQSIIDLGNLPFYPDQPSALRSKLLPHQLQALAWCIKKEHPKLPKTAKEQHTQFWTYKKEGGSQYYYNIATSSANEEPVLSRGGILADDMGLGKTLTMISLILCDDKGSPIIHNGASKPYHGKSTLIVAPMSVLDNWVKQIEDHVKPGAVSVYVYYGTDRTTKLDELGNYDIVITTYQVLAQEYRDEKVKGRRQAQVLTKMRWRRIILDEGHVICNRNTKRSKVCASMQAERRWIMSGTPIMNSVNDLYGLLRFLKFRPFDDYNWWSRVFARPLRRGEQHPLELLKILMKDLTIRRTKEMKIEGKPILDLPPCNIYLHKIEFSPEESAFYSQIEAEGKQLIRKFLQDETMETNYAVILQIMMRLRQICDDSSLCPSHAFDQFTSQGEQPLVDMDDENVKRLLSILKDAEDSGEDCPICLDTLKNCVITLCRHFFCRPCIEQVITTNPDNASCPLCRHKISVQTLLSLPPEPELPEEESAKIDSCKGKELTQRLPMSSKARTLIEFLMATPPGIKTIVYSQWTKMLDTLGTHLNDSGIPYARFDGSMSRKKRETELMRFKVGISAVKDSPNVRSKRKAPLDDDPAENPCVLLASLKAGAVGLNITEASQVVVFDPWWNSAMESQAIDRVYRLGQTKPVNVFRFVVSNTIEERVVEIQAEKSKLIQKAFSGISGAAKERREQRLQDIKELFAIDEQAADSV
ncbi:SNF2 family N-terminal domain-containing protein [Paraphysoderma sedebokerense]|nr:SNF2 family N-terminal domain-containing protein [Paraphysoderma sedebokerense]